MPKIETSELTGAALDWAVAKCEKLDPVWDEVREDFYLAADHMHNLTHLREYRPSTDWAQGGPIIDREWIQLEPWPNESDENFRWKATQFDLPQELEVYGPTPLIAAMRCYVASKLGDTVDVPGELTK